MTVRRATFLISSLFLLVKFYLQYFLSPKGRFFLILFRKIFAYAQIYHNKRSYSDMTCAYIRLYKTTFDHRWASLLSNSTKWTNENYKVHKWTSLWLSSQVDKFITKAHRWASLLSKSINWTNL